MSTVRSKWGVLICCEEQFLIPILRIVDKCSSGGERCDTKNCPKTLYNYVGGISWTHNVTREDRIKIESAYFRKMWRLEWFTRCSVNKSVFSISSLCFPFVCPLERVLGSIGAQSRCLLIFRGVVSYGEMKCFVDQF